MGLELLNSELRKDSPTSTHADNAEELRESALSAVEILDNLLNYEKLDSGAMVLELKSIFGCKFVQRKVRPFQQQARSKDIDLQIATTEFDLTHWWVNADHVKLGQVLSNFLSNSIKFSPIGGSVAVHMKVLNRDDGDWFRVEVQDSGHGISAENQLRVFKDVVQFHANAQQRGGGSGLGLWISRKIAELHGGRVGLRSAGEGHGCTFFVELPAFSTPLERGTSEEQDLSPQLQVAEPGLAMDSMQVLVVDDSRLNRKMLNRMLTSMGHTCDEAEDGQMAVERWKQAEDSDAPYKAILMDEQMPNMTGSQATVELRRLGYQGLILGLTGNTLPEEVAAFIACGANEVLSKPTEGKHIRAALRRHEKSENRCVD